MPNDEQKKGPILNLREPLRIVGNKESPFTLSGDVLQGVLGDPKKEHSGVGVRLLSGKDLNKDGKKSGSLSCTVGGLKPENGRWYRVQIRGLAQEDFAVEKDDLFVKVEFFKENGKNPLDHIRKSIYGQVELRAQEPGRTAGTNATWGSAAWRNYSIEFRTPFPEVDTLRVSVEFGHGAGKAATIRVLGCARSTVVADTGSRRLQSAGQTGCGQESARPQVAGEAWAAAGTTTRAAAARSRRNSSTTPMSTGSIIFGPAGNPVRRATCRPGCDEGYLDRDGKLVEKDQFVADAVVISFTEKHLVMKSKNLPNHPTAVFPTAPGSSTATRTTFRSRPTPGTSRWNRRRTRITSPWTRTTRIAPCRWDRSAWRSTAWCSSILSTPTTWKRCGGSTAAADIPARCRSTTTTSIRFA